MLEEGEGRRGGNRSAFFGMVTRKKVVFHEGKGGTGGRRRLMDALLKSPDQINDDSFIM